MSKSETVARWMTLAEPQGISGLVITSLRGQESLSRLFSFDLGLAVPPDSAEKVEELLGKSISVQLALAGGPVRWITGMANRVAWKSEDARYTRYSLRVVPPIWPLTQNCRSRVFQNQSVPDILKTVFHGFELSERLHESYVAHNYCVQYQESDFAFANRLMEEEGIFYCFEHERDGCRLVVADASHLAHELPGRFVSELAHAQGEVREQTQIDKWSVVRHLTPTKANLIDHSFELSKPALSSEESGNAEIEIGAAKRLLNPSGFAATVAEFPAGYAHRFDGVPSNGSDMSTSMAAIYPEGKRLAKVRLQRAQSSGVRVRGRSDCSHFVPGYRTKLANAGRMNGEYFLTEVEHDAWQPLETGDGFRGPNYKNRFVCIPRNLAYRPAAKTPRPRVHGVQSATVVGPEGEDIHTDVFGRVKVRFFWEGSGDSSGGSCWLRVAQNWAGKGFGMTTLPRVGQEVLVGFVDGDPDMPVVLASVHNLEQMPIVPLPQLRTSTGIVTHTKGGGPGQFHRLVFNDEPGSESVQLHSERDLMVSSENAHSTWAQNLHQTYVGGTHRTSVGGLTLDMFTGSNSKKGSSDSKGEYDPPTDSDGTPPATSTTGNERTGVVSGWSSLSQSSWWNSSDTWSTNLFNDLKKVLGMSGKLEVCATGTYSTEILMINESTTIGMQGTIMITIPWLIKSLLLIPTLAALVEAAGKTFGIPSGITAGGYPSATHFGLDAVKLGYSKFVWGSDTAIAFGPRFTATHATNWDSTGSGPAQKLVLSILSNVYILMAAEGVIANAVLPQFTEGISEDTNDKINSAMTVFKAIVEMFIAGMEYKSFNVDAAARKTAEWANLSKTLLLAPAALEAMSTAYTAHFDLHYEALIAAGTGGHPHGIGEATDDLKLVRGDSMTFAENFSIVATSPLTGGAAFVHIAAGGSNDGTPSTMTNPGVVMISAANQTMVRGGKAMLSLWSDNPVSNLGNNVCINAGPLGTIALQSGATDTSGYLIEAAPKKFSAWHPLLIELSADPDPLAPAAPTISIGYEKIDLSIGPTTSLLITPAKISLQSGASLFELSDAGLSISAGGCSLLLGAEGAGISSPTELLLQGPAGINVKGAKVNETV